MKRKHVSCVLVLVMAALCTLPMRAQQHFPHDLPAGNYSGICPIGDDRYAVVSDKSAEDGFFVFQLTLDAGRQRVTAAKNEGFRSSGLQNRDMEGICYFPPAGTLFISGEADNEVYEYQLDGRRTGRRLAMPDEFHRARRNLGLESLTYDTLRHRFYTTTERPLPGDSLLRIQAFGDDLQPAGQWLYKPDAPLSRKHYHGVAELLATGDGRLLVLERQLRVPKKKIGATTLIRLYEVSLSEDERLLQKRLVKEFRTRLTLTSRKFANYEGMCQPCPGLLLMIADSQNQYQGVLHDWLLLIKGI